MVTIFLLQKMKCVKCGSDMSIEKYSYTVIAECINCCYVEEIAEDEYEENL